MGVGSVVTIHAGAGLPRQAEFGLTPHSTTLARTRSTMAVGRGYCALSASVGWTRNARRVGTMHASMQTPNIIAA